MKNLIELITHSVHKKPILIGVVTAMLIILIGSGLAFATGIAIPSHSYAEDFMGDNGTTDYSSGTTDSFTVNDTESLPCNCDAISPSIVDTTPTFVNDTESLPCNCDILPPVFVDTQPPFVNDTESLPCNCDFLPPVFVDTTPTFVNDTESLPCNCDILPPVIEIPSTDIPPVVIPPIEIPPIVIPPVVIIPPPPPPPPPPPALAACISLTGTPHTISSGDAVTLAWQTQNATSITIDNGVGSVTPVAAGSTIVHPTTDTTYTATVANAVGSVHCQTSVVVTVVPPPPPVPACIQLTANATTIYPGQPIVLSWVTSNASGISIDNGVGSVVPVASGSITVTPTENTTYHATVPNAPINPACSVPVTIIQPTGGGGGGGGGGTSGGGSGQIIQSIPQAPAAAYVYLSQIPYTGLDLGPVGTIVYWTLLALWCVAAAYLVIFVLIPFVYRRMHSFGSNVGEMLNQPAGNLAMAGVGATAAHGSYVPAAHVTTQVEHTDVHVDAHAPITPAIRPNPSAYAAAEGFKAFAQNDSLTIDDIVKGLSRLPETQAVHAAVPAPVVETRTTITKTVDRTEDGVHAQPVMAPQHSMPAPRTQAPMAAVSTDVRDFIAALLNADRDTVFATVRQIVREGGDAEAFMTQVVCALDDAYRARIENTKVNPEVAKLTQNCATSFLERLTAALTNAVDSSYSPGVTGSKLALTRALGVIEG